MARFIGKSDFINGPYAIPRDKLTKKDLQIYIDKFEPHYLIKMLGANEYKSMIADWDANPYGQFSEAKYQAIYNEILLEDDCRTIYSEGMKVMLQAFIYFEYMRDQNVKKTIGGLKNNEVENSTEADVDQSNLNACFNNGVVSYNAIQYYMCWNSENYDYIDPLQGKRLKPNSIL